MTCAHWSDLRICADLKTRSALDRPYQRLTRWRCPGDFAIFPTRGPDESYPSMDSSALPVLHFNCRFCRKTARGQGAQFLSWVQRSLVRAELRQQHCLQPFGLVPSSSSFDPSFVDKMFDGMQAGGAKIVRIWVFPALQGIELGEILDHQPVVQCRPPTTPQTLGLTQDLIPTPPTVGGNLEQVFLLAQKHHLMVYVTALNGNDMSVAATTITGLRPYFQNLLTNTKWGAGPFQNVRFASACYANE